MTTKICVWMWVCNTYWHPVELGFFSFHTGKPVVQPLDLPEHRHSRLVLSLPARAVGECTLEMLPDTCCYWQPMSKGPWCTQRTPGRHLLCLGALARLGAGRRMRGGGSQIKLNCFCLHSFQTEPRAIFGLHFRDEILRMLVQALRAHTLNCCDCMPTRYFQQKSLIF